jgi:hypothetical protein
LKGFGLRVMKTPVRTPKADAYCERLVGTSAPESYPFLSLRKKFTSPHSATTVANTLHGRILRVAAVADTFLGRNIMIDILKFLPEFWIHCFRTALSCL